MYDMFNKDGANSSFLFRLSFQDGVLEGPREMAYWNLRSFFIL